MTTTTENMLDAMQRAIYLAQISAAAHSGAYPVPDPMPVYSVVQWQAPRRGKPGRFLVTTEPSNPQQIVAQYTCY